MATENMDSVTIEVLRRYNQLSPHEKAQFLRLVRKMVEDNRKENKQ